MMNKLLPILLFSAPAFANLRAPLVDPTPPSSALSAVPELVVLGEDLRFDCEVERCQVTATYRVKASAALKATTAFIAPIAADITASVDGETVTVGEPRAVKLGEGGGRWRNDDAFEIPFAFALDAGAHTLDVKYTQPLGVEESGHSYFSDGDMLRTWRYLSGSLHDWKRAKGFALQVEAAVDAGKAGMFGMFDARSVHCHGGETRAVVGVRTKAASRWRLKLRFDEVPEALSCFIGPPGSIPPLKS